MRKPFLALLLCIVALNLLSPFIPKTEGYLLTTTTVIYGTSSDAYLFYEPPGDYSTAWTAMSATVYSGTVLNVGQRLFMVGWYNIFRDCLFFDTSVLPDNANITSAILSLYCNNDYSAQNFNVTIQNGQPTYPHDSVTTGDYFKDHYSGNGGQWDTNGYAAGYVNITLNADGRDWIQKTTATKLMLRSSRDISGTAPTIGEHVQIRSYEHSGESSAPKLFITYTIDGWHLHINGPYFESGLVAPYLVNVTLSKLDAAPYSFSLDGAGGADLVEVNCTTQPTALSWNITSPSTNKTRTMHLTSETFEEVYIFIPNDDEPYYLYTFTVTDFAGITNGYLETVINVNGSNRIVERQSLDLINAVPFWMTWAHRYELRIICDEGTYNYGGFIALSEQNQGLIITKDMFPVAQPGMNVTVSALRLNATWLQVNYTDSQAQTYWLYVAFKTKQGYGWAIAYSTNNTGQTQQINWYSASATLDYRVTVTALRTEQSTWTFSLPKAATTTNPWTGLLDILGTLPFPVAQLVGVCLVVCFAGAFSYINTGLGCVVMVLIAGILTYIGWLQITSGAIGLALTISIIYVIYEAKKQEREV